MPRPDVCPVLACPRARLSLVHSNSLLRGRRVARVRVLRTLVLKGWLDPAVLKLVGLSLAFFFTVHLVACFYWLLVRDYNRDSSEACEAHLGP